MGGLGHRVTGSQDSPVNPCGLLCFAVFLQTLGLSALALGSKGSFPPLQLTTPLGLWFRLSYLHQSPLPWVSPRLWVHLSTSEKSLPFPLYFLLFGSPISPGTFLTLSISEVQAVEGYPEGPCLGGAQGPGPALSIRESGRHQGVLSQPHPLQLILAQEGSSLMD